jgi:hypothetical protein
LLLLGVLLAALLGACSEKSAPLFPHRLHLAELSCNAPGRPACLTCNSCHVASGTERDYPPPPEALCVTCHQGEGGLVRASLGAVAPRPYGEIAIDHERHLAMPEIRGQCVTCHSGVVERGSGASPLPPMSRCFTCHEHEQQWQRAECGPCHQASDLARTPPETFLQHDSDFMRHHGDLAPFDKALCRSCHEQRDCQSCHDLTQDLTAEIRAPERIEGPFVHRGDFLSRHSIEARATPTGCATCHTPETCDACHVARGVSGNALEATNPHPPGWVTNSAAYPSLHGREARRDIVACAGCHEQGPATNCIRCHRVGGYGGNPHPAGWRSARSTSAEMCRYCHG